MKSSLAAKWFCRLGLLGLVLGLTMVLPSCASREPTAQDLFYSLDYPAPGGQGLAKLAASIKVRRFSAAPGWSGSDMYYGSSKLELSSYNFHRWLVSPSDMVSDFLARDLRAAGVFRAVFSYHETETARFLVQGGVRRIQELDHKDGAKAMLAVSVMLIDSEKSAVDQRVVFQRWYRAEHPMADKEARSLAKAMGQAMSKLSAAILADVHKAVSQRLGKQ